MGRWEDCWKVGETVGRSGDRKLETFSEIGKIVREAATSSRVWLRHHGEGKMWQ